MKQIVLAVALTLVFGLAALAQDTTQNSQQTGSQGTSPSATSPSTSGQQTPDTAAGSQSSTPAAPSASIKGEKKLRGCIESQGGQYALHEKNGKQIALTGAADFASHVGHMVTVHGSYENAASASSSASTSGSEKLPSSSGNPAGGASATANAGEQFMVSKIDHESDTCKLEKGKSKGSSGMAAPNPTPNTPPERP